MELQHAITPQIPLRLVGEFTGAHTVPPAGCGYFSGFALKKLHDHSTEDLAEVRASRLDVYQARENFLIQQNVITDEGRILTHRHQHPLMFADAIPYLTFLGLTGYAVHEVLGAINAANVCEKINTHMAASPPTHGLMVAHLLSGQNAHWMSILRRIASGGFLVYDPCGAGGFADHVRVITPERMSQFYGRFPWSHIIGAPLSTTH
ncbi:MAG: hypothetical protein KDK04_09715 [Candidatus Competibacteraceae bacterium]|nr:hypothetical protein [Candidatus Competibacteraceae bacterium]